MRKISPREDRRLHKLSEFCLSLPETDRTICGDHADFRVRGKVFTYFLSNHHGDGIVSVCCKTALGVNVDRASRDPRRFYLPAYIGPRGWLGMRLDLGNIEDAKRVQQRLIDLGFLFGSADGIWGPRSRRALEDFRAAQKIGQGDAWDETTQQLLFGESAVRAPVPSSRPDSYVGGWGNDLADCRQSQGGWGHLTITARRAEAFGTVCEFQSAQQEGPNMWRLQAKCANSSERWSANIRFTILGNKLTWSSERGTVNYVRCAG